MTTPTIHVATCLIADLLAIPPEEVTSDLLFSFGIGWMDTGACCVNWRPGRDHATAPATSLTGAYSIVTGDLWPAPLPNLLTEGSDGNG